MHKTNRMTFALAVKCADGAILATDTRFTVNGGSDHVYGHKITGEISGVLTAFAGSREPFEEFRMRLREFTAEPEEKRRRLDQLWIRIKEIMRSLNQQYSQHEFDVLVATNLVVPHTILRYFYQDGRSEQIEKYKAIGAGAPYGQIYLETLYREDLTMHQAAGLAYFIVRYIERFKLELTVGTGGEFPHPLIRFIPPLHLSEIYEVEPTKNQYELYETNVQIRLNKIEKSLVSDYYEL